MRLTLGTYIGQDGNCGNCLALRQRTVGMSPRESAKTERNVKQNITATDVTTEDSHIQSSDEKVHGTFYESWNWNSDSRGLRRRSFIAAHYQTSGTVDSLLLSIHKTVDVFAKAGLKSLSVGLAETSLGSCAFRIGLRHVWRVTSVLPLQMTLRTTNVSLTLTCRLGLCFFYFTSSNQLCRSTLLAFCITWLFHFSSRSSENFS